MLKAPERARADLLNKGGTLTKVVIATYFEEEYVRRIREVDERLRVLYKEDLVPPPRWPGDHAGPEEWERTPDGEGDLMAMLQHAKELDHLRSDKAGKVWRQGAVGTLENKTLCVVGMGSIGRAIARRARPFGMRIVGVKRTVREDDEAWEDADELYPTAELSSALGEADYVAVTLPGTTETRRLLDAEAIAAIKQGAYFANVGRGSVVDEPALVEALQGGHLSGAALDVFEVEPLPEESPLWKLDNVIVSAHTTDVVPDLINSAQTDLFCENLRRYLADDELLNVLDKRLLY